jgi:hypothetical protein
MNNTFEPFIALVIDGELKGQSLAFESDFIQATAIKSSFGRLVFVNYYAHMIHAGSYRYMVASVAETLNIEYPVMDMLIEHTNSTWFRTDMLEGFSDSSRRYHIVSPVV